MEQLRHDNIDELCDFLKRAEYTFGWCLVQIDGVEKWQVDAYRGHGQRHLISRDKDLSKALYTIKNAILGMN